MRLLKTFPRYERRVLTALVVLAIILSSANLSFYFKNRVELRLVGATERPDVHP